MSSMPSAILTRGKSAIKQNEWGSTTLSSYAGKAEIHNEEVIAIHKPIVVDGDELEIESSMLEVGKVYTFDYLGSHMILWKTDPEAIVLFEIVDE